jgi:hypothetical protein
VQYVALSYCWGTTAQRGTTRSNISSRRQSINVSELPKTLQDAIRVAQSLGFQYIWIDSLCIVQDDVDDWATESSNMAHIYSAACLVIAATRAKDCAEGFLQPWKEPPVLDWNLPSKPLSKVTARSTTSHACPSQNPIIDGQPLHGRAWAMQERELARRIVHFLPDEISWRCQKIAFCECGIPEDPLDSLDSTLRSSALASFPSHGIRDRCDEHTFSVAWIKLLVAYGHLGITQPTDTLPALSGIARYIEHLQPGQYIAGLWEKDIAMQLAWSVNNGIHVRRPRDSLEGPTFSWISARRTFRYIESGPGYEARCTFVAATQTLATANPYGHVLDCSLALRGRTIQTVKFSARIVQAKERDKGSHKRTRVWLQLDGDDDYCSPFLDSRGNMITVHDIFDQPCVVCLELYRSKRDGPRNDAVATALVLQQRVGETSYTRLGLAFYIPPTWFDKDGVEEIVTIV